MVDQSLALETQKLNTGADVVLFRLDATVLGASIYSFSPNVIDGAGPVFGGVSYTPVDVRFSGFEMSGAGVLPTPRFEVSNTDGWVQQIVNQYGDLVGCTLQRIRTFERFLDGKPDADPLSFFGPDTFRIERKVSEESIMFQWELSAAIDQEGKQLPGRQVIRDFCPKRYRVWNALTETFDYSRATCPYSDTPMFKADGTPTAVPAEDSCGRRVGQCELRYGVGTPLPFGGFPGVARTGS